MSSTYRKKRVVVTALTEMRAGVCIAGIDHNGNWVRPVFSHRQITDQYLLDSNGNLMFKPLNRVTMELSSSCVLVPPHTEDCKWNGKTIEYAQLALEEKATFLDGFKDTSVYTIFGGSLNDKKFVKPGEGKRSLGLIECKQITEVLYEKKRSSPYRFSFMDLTYQEFDSRPVTDLAWRGYYNHINKQNGNNSDKTNEELVEMLNSSEKIYLSLGLSRPFQGKCWLMITGIFTLPDYLGGRSFLDFEVDK